MLTPTFSVLAVSRIPAPLKAITVICSLTRACGLHKYKWAGRRGGSHGNETGHVLSDSVHDDKPEQTDNGDNER